MHYTVSSVFSEQLGVHVHSYRIPAGHGKPGKSWNCELNLSGLEKSWKIILNPKSHGKVMGLTLHPLVLLIF
jgi:hypothetical protein